jgi:5'-3' exonuclease
MYCKDLIYNFSFTFFFQNRLLTAIRSVEHLLTDEEKGRNGHGPHLCYEYTPEAGEPYPSPLPDFPDIAVRHSKYVSQNKKLIQVMTEIKKHFLNRIVPMFYSMLKKNKKEKAAF